MRTGRMTHQARRAAILETAVRLFSEKGFRGVTTRELAASVGVSEPVLYQHFQTKRDLYRAIIEERAICSGCGAPEDFGLNWNEITDDRQFLIELAHGIINWHTEDPTYARLLVFSALEQHEMSEMFIDRYARSFQTGLAQFFERRIAEGRFRKLDPVVAAHSFIGLACNVGMNRAILQRAALDLPPEHVVNEFVDIFLQGVKKQI